MTIYNVETQEAYDTLMSELEVKGYKWLSGYKPTQKNYWEKNEEDSCIEILGKYIGFMNIEQSKKKCPNIPIIEYKAKGENMAEEMKQYFLNESRDVSIAIENFVIDDSTTENHLSKAKSSAKKLIEKIDEYLEAQKPEFKAGDYITVYFKDRTIISKIDELTENETVAHGIWYDQTKVNVKQDFWFISKVSKCRYATSEEIAEYEVALTFYKHGRKPFELKEGDLIRTPSEKLKFILNPESYTKEDFLVYGWEFRIPVEEVNEWLENK